MTQIAIFVLTTGGLVQIQRITRERAPLSMMVLGRGSERLPVSERYDDFVYPGGGPVERFLGPFPEGGFRLEVSGPIDSGDSWQLAAFVAHAVLAAEDCTLCREVEEAGQIVCLTGLVDFDGQVGGVGHIPEKLQAAEAQLTEWAAGDTPLLIVVPDGPDHERLLAIDPPAAMSFRATNISEVCKKIGVKLAPAAVAMVAPKPAKPRQRRRWPLALTALMVLILAAGAYALLSEMPADQAAEGKPPPPKVVKATPPQPKPLPETTVPAKTLAAEQQLLKKPVVLKPTVPEPSVPKNIPVTSPKDLVLPAKLPAVAVLERHAPAGQGCDQIYFGKAQAVMRPVPVAEPGRFKASGGDDLCGVMLRIELGVREQYALVKLELLEGRLVGALRPPGDLSGRRLVAGRRDWKLDLPHRGMGSVRYRLTLTTSETPIRSEGGADKGSRHSINLLHEVLR